VEIQKPAGFYFHVARRMQIGIGYQILHARQTLEEMDDCWAIERIGEDFCCGSIVTWRLLPLVPANGRNGRLRHYARTRRVNAHDHSDPFSYCE
jgi:hypothetical protein